MAFVGTARRLGDARTTLASMIQGEARTYAGQVAVANVVRNRAAINFGGYGRDAVSQATAYKQFQGQQRPTAQSFAVADSLLDGTLPNTLPNALNYAAPKGTTARWALSALGRGEGVNPGGEGNTFWANSRGDAPVYNPGALTGANSNIGTGTNAGGFPQQGVLPANGVEGSVGSEWQSYREDGSGNAEVVLGFDGTDGSAKTGGMTAAQANGTGFSGMNAGQGAGATDQTFGSYYGMKDGGAFGGGSATKGTANQTGKTGAGTAGTGGGSGGGGGGMGMSMTVPQAIDNQTRGNASDTQSLNQTSKANTEAVNKTNKENTEALNKTSTANTKSVTDKAQGIYDATAGAWSDYFVRLVFIILGLIAVAAALVALAKPNLPIPGLAALRATGLGKAARKLA